MIKNEALKHLNSQHNLHKRHAKWVAFLQQFNYSIQHKAGALNKAADGLSRSMLYCALWRQWCLALSHFRTITRQTISYNQYSQPCNRVSIVSTLISTQLMGFCSKVINYVFLHAPYEHKFCKKSIIKVILAKMKLFLYYNRSTFGMVWQKMWLSLSKGAWFVRKPKVPGFLPNPT